MHDAGELKAIFEFEDSPIGKEGPLATCDWLIDGHL